MKLHTLSLLRHSARLRIRKLAVSCTHESVPSSVTSGPFRNSVASSPAKYEGWSAVWEAVKRTNLGSHGGNLNQSWIKSPELLDPGVYVFNTRTRQWSRTWVPVYKDLPASICTQCGHEYQKHYGRLEFCIKDTGDFDPHRSFVNSGRVLGARKYKPVVVCDVDALES